MTRALFLGAGLLGAVLSTSGMPTPAREAPVPVRVAGSSPESPEVSFIRLDTLASGLGSITSITSAGDARVFLTLQTGTVVIWDGTRILPTPFLDVSAKVICCDERGLLSIVFHPSFATNGFFFIDYTNLNGDTVIERYHVSGDPSHADPSSETILLTITQPPFPNHKGGQLQFGPDGFLYIGMGDGGSANDPNCNAQSPTSMLGKLLRIDVDSHADSAPFYAVPPDNPFVANGGAPPEAWSKGVRNPWRFSFDRKTGDLVIGDVGQGAREEVDFQPAGDPGGENYGWKVMEGTICGTDDSAGCVPPVPPCHDPSYTLPVLDYSHDDGSCAIIGGYVYRGLEVPELYGMYVYGDLCTGKISDALPGTWAPSVLPVGVPNLSTFGEDSFGELYAGSTDGTLYRFAATIVPLATITGVAPSSGLAAREQRVTVQGTNFTRSTQVFFGGVPAAAVTVESTTLLVAVAPAGPAGTVDVSVMNPGSQAATLTGAFSYLPIQRAPRHGSPRTIER